MKGYIISYTSSAPCFWDGTSWTSYARKARVYITKQGAQKVIDKQVKQGLWCHEWVGLVAA